MAQSGDGARGVEEGMSERQSEEPNQAQAEWCSAMLGQEHFWSLPINGRKICLLCRAEKPSEPSCSKIREEH